MLSYEVYKVVHVFSVIVFVALGFMAISKDDLSKAVKITIGTFSVLVLVGGMGLLARIGVSHGAGWPTWVIVKLLIWLFLGAFFGVASKRGIKNKPMGYGLASVAVLVSVIMAVFKSFT